MPRVVALALLLLLSACGDPAADDPAEAAEAAEAAPVAEDDPGTFTFPGERPDETADVFADFDGDTPGCSVAVRTPEDDHVATFGVADLATGERLNPSTIFDVGSVSKQITAGAVALLIVDGELDPDDPIDAWLDVGPFEEPITVADLVHHTSGLPDYIELLDAELDAVTTMDDALAVIAGPDGAPVAEPGTEFEYSNSNYVLLAELVEAVSGQTLVDFADERIFGPLDMADSRYRDDQGDLDPGQAQGYEDTGDGWVETGSAWRQVGDGAVHTTPRDLLRWAGEFVTDDPLFGEEWVELMTTPGPVPDGEDGYAGGLGVIDGGEVLAHGGSWIGYSSALTMRPNDGVAVAVACNIDGLDAEGLAADVTALWSS